MEESENPNSNRVGRTKFLIFMKLESLKEDKFEPFKDNKIRTAISIIGGEPKNTNYTNIRYTGTDIIDTETHPSPKDLAHPTSTLEGRPGTVDYQQTSWNRR